MKNCSKSYGKRIEENIVRSLRMAGLAISVNGELDHNKKIDFVLQIGRQPVGIQCSLKNDPVKARVARICALDVVPRFIYLHIADGFFRQPEKGHGRDLYRILSWSIDSHPHYNAFMLSIQRRGLKIRNI